MSLRLKMFNPRCLLFERVGNGARECRFIHFKRSINKIGRSSNMDVYINSENANTISREHSLVEFINGRMYISNLSKTNPTFLNHDKVIRKTEVEEGDLIGFGSKPDCIYPDLREDQIFIYECKSNMDKSGQQQIIILDDSEDDDDIEIIDEIDNPIQSTPTNLVDLKNEKNSLESKITELEVAIETPPMKPEYKLLVEHPKRSIQQPLLKSVAIESSKKTKSDKNVSSLHIDTVESINDLSSSESESSTEDGSSKNVIEAENMLNVKIMLKKLTQEEMEQWKSKLEECYSDDEFEYSDVPDEPEKEDKKSESEDSSEKKDKFLLNKMNFSKSKFDNLAKSLEMREKIRSLVDDDDSDDGLFSNLPKNLKEHKQTEPIKKSIVARSESIENNRLKSVPTFKRRISTNEKYDKDSKKLKMEEPIIVKKMYKFPGASITSSTSSNANKSKNNDVTKRRSSLSELKNDTDSSDSAKKAQNSNKIFKRRMSLCPTSHPKIVTPHIDKKKLPLRRQTISESRITEIDMFSKASEMRMKKWGPTGKPSDKVEKEVPKSFETPYTIKKPKIREGVDKNIVSQEVKKILDPILSRLEPKTSPFSPVSKTIPPPNNENKQQASSSKNDQIDDIQKAASLVKAKVTAKTRADFLTEAIPKKPAPLRRTSTFNEPQPSTSKDVMSVALFRNKYIKPNDEAIVNKVPSIDPIPEDILDSLNAKINMEMKMQHEQLAVETTLTTCEQESPDESSSDNEELNLDTDDDLDKEEETLGFYTLINDYTPTNEILSPQIDPDSPMKDDPRGKTKWVTSEQDEANEQVERSFELERFPSTPNFSSTIHVHHDKPVEDIKKILKPISPLYVSPSKQNNKKRVSFNDYNLVDIVRFGSDDSPISTCNQQIAHVPPMRSSVRNPKNYESAACAELMEWDFKWITLINNELPWKVEQHKNSYNSLQDYKNELKTVMNVELLKRLISKYKTIASKEKTWNFMTVKERRDEQNNHIKLILGCDSKDMKQGTMLLLKVRDTNSITRKPIDINFLGYVTAINDRGELKLDTYCKELRKEKAVLKSTCLIHLRNDIKLFAVLNCIQDTPFMKLFLNPSLNKMDRNEGITSFNIEFKMASIKLCPEQRIIVKKLSYECTKDDTEKIIFINGCAGSGKTFMMLSAVLNLKFCLKEKKRYLICTSTITGIDEIAETLYNMPHSSALNIVRIGYREQLIGSGRKLGINEQVQQKINNGVKGKSYKEIQKEIIENADIILSTIRSCYDLFDYQLHIDTCFIDEANFAIDAELMILVQLNVKKMVFIGDEYQLEPTQSLVYKETRCNNSYFNRILNYYKSIKFANAPVFTLLTQHRMNKDLFYISTKYVYNDSMAYKPVNSMSTANFPFKSFAVFTLDVISNDQKFLSDEINFFCMKLCEILPKTVSIGIVNGFPSQRDKCRIKLDTDDRRIECLAVDTIQGIEKDVIILTLRNTETYFMHNFNRINVALTRARKALYVCSNMNMILYPNEAGVFLRLKDDARNRDLYHVIQKFDFDRLYSMLRK